MVTKRILCLANSEKGSGHCVAGIELLPDGSTGEWIRPIGSGHEDALTDREQAYADGTNPQLLDIVDVQLLNPDPQGCQTENWRVDPEYWWSKEGTYSPANAATIAQNPPLLFLNVGRTSKGLNDQIPNTMADTQVIGSLCLIRVPALQVQVTSGYNEGSLEIRAEFAYQGVPYRLKITDPLVKSEFLQRGIGQHDLGECLACISLAAPFQKPHDGIWYRYKVVAGIVRLS